MIANLYKYECITNLHVGSGEVNYNIIDNEVETDPVTHYPMIHASGVKGALREHFSGLLPAEVINRIFGAPPKHKEEIKAGSYKFLDACFLARPMRVCGDTTMASIPVISEASVCDFLQKLSMLGLPPFSDGISLGKEVFGKNAFLTNVGDNISVEGEATGKLPASAVAALKPLEQVIGAKYAIAKNLEEYDLPVLARNYLENGISKQLWYEQIVPHGSIFYQIILTPDQETALNLDGKIVQFGGNASIGCGFVKITKLTSAVI